MKKVLSIILIIVILLLLLCYKSLKSGNNKSTIDIENYFLNIKSYKADIEVTVNSNKNENKYLIKQEVKDGYEKQIVVEPEEIKGVELIYKDKKLEIKNNKLQLSTIYENYDALTNNSLFLNDFIIGYKESENKEISESGEMIIMKYGSKISNYNRIHELKIKKKELTPEILEIKDNNNKTNIYILYKEIELSI